MGNMSIDSNKTNTSLTEAFQNLTKDVSKGSSAPVPTPASTPAPAPTSAPTKAEAPAPTPPPTVTAPIVDQAAQGVLGTLWHMVRYESVGDIVSERIVAPIYGESELTKLSGTVSLGVIAAQGYGIYKEAPKAYDAIKRRNWKEILVHGGLTGLLTLRTVHELYYGQLRVPKFSIDVKLEF